MFNHGGNCLSRIDFPHRSDDRRNLGAQLRCEISNPETNLSPAHSPGVYADYNIGYVSPTIVLAPTGLAAEEVLAPPSAASLALELQTDASLQERSRTHRSPSPGCARRFTRASTLLLLAQLAQPDRLRSFAPVTALARATSPTDDLANPISGLRLTPHQVQ
ncbi:hypothetical protein CCMA1212_001151 [Trichoderma ghanense]|uniref:Uncharacterized protein n=1 Tax=Trichoderma ghanense TaxID=65468 RepID=A0ABY2HGY0_9HYPO